MSPRIFRGEVSTAHLLLAGSLLFTLAFNVRWAWGSEPLSVLAAAVCTLIMPCGIVLWSRIRVVVWWHGVLRLVLLGGICASAACTSFSHSVSVLLTANWSILTACAVTGGAELLAALSTMALQFPALLKTEALTEQVIFSTEETATSTSPAPPEPEPVREPVARVVSIFSAGDPPADMNLRAGMSAASVVFELLDRALAAELPEPSGPELTEAVRRYGHNVNANFGRTTRARWRRIRVQPEEVSV